MLLLPLAVWLCSEIARSQLVEAQCNGGDSCCSLLNKCGKGEGDCDNHNDCFGELQCGRDNCKPDASNGFDQTDDCCFDPIAGDAAGILGCHGGDNCCSDNNQCSENEGDAKSFY